MQTSLSQENTPLLSKLAELTSKQDAPFYAPGHKKGKGIPKQLKSLLGEKVFQADLPELPELDNLFNPEGVIKEAQELAKEAFRADKTWFLANGSTSGIIASILATCGEGDKIILPRNVHQSAIFGLILSGAKPIFLNPEYDKEFDIAYNLSLNQILKALNDNSGVKAVLLVSPTYHGICANLTEIAHCLANHNIPLIVDEAHGGHFHFHPSLPMSALEAGANIVIQSTHKVLGAMTQASMLHLKGNLVSVERVSRALQLVQSSSPSYLLLASLDSARQQMAMEGEFLLAKTLDLALFAREKVSSFDYLSILNLRDKKDNFYDLDLTRLTVNVSKLGLTGYEVDEILHDEFAVTCELPSLKTLTFIISIGNSKEDIDRLINAFQCLKKYQNIVTKNLYSLTNFAIPELKFTPRQAFYSETITVSQNEAINQVSGETICPYPPGIPLIMAGEVITLDAIASLNDIITHGGIITGASDSSLQTMKIIRISVKNKN